MDCVFPEEGVTFRKVRSVRYWVGNLVVSACIVFFAFAFVAFVWNKKAEGDAELLLLLGGFIVFALLLLCFGLYQRLRKIREYMTINKDGIICYYSNDYIFVKHETIQLSWNEIVSCQIESAYEGQSHIWLLEIYRHGKKRPAWYRSIDISYFRPLRTMTEAMNYYYHWAVTEDNSVDNHDIIEPFTIKDWLCKPFSFKRRVIGSGGQDL